MVKFSIIVPILNVENVIESFLDSILNQSLKELEIFCIDYQCSEFSSNVIKSKIKEDNRIHIFSIEENDTTSCLDDAQGKYILFAFGHECYSNDALENIYNAFEECNSDILLFDYDEYKANNKVNSKKYFSKKSRLLSKEEKKSLLNKSQSINSKAYRKSFIKDKKLRFSNNIFLSEISFDFKSVSISNKIFYYDNKLFKSFKSENYLFLEDNDKFSIFSTFSELKEFLEANNLFEEYESELLILKFNEYKKVLYSISKNLKEKFYQAMRDEFIKLNVNPSVLRGLPLKLYSFYILILNEESYSGYVKYSNNVKKKLNYINKNKLQKEIDNYDEVGVTSKKRDNLIIVSLTSFPKRIIDIHYCIYSILNQNFKPDEVILWLAEEQFPNKQDDLPDSLLALEKNGLTIKWCHDIKSYKKLIPILKEYPNDFIVTADDDIFYPSDWLGNMWEEYQKNPKTIISSRARLIKLDSKNNIQKYNKWGLINKKGISSYLNFPTGAGGTLYFPNALSDLVFEEKLFMEFCPSTDDIWFWAMAILNKTKISPIDKPLNNLKYVNIARDLGIIDSPTLWQVNRDGNNDKQLNNIINYFPEILKTIKDDL